MTKFKEIKHDKKKTLVQSGSQEGQVRCWANLEQTSSKSQANLEQISSKSRANLEQDSWTHSTLPVDFILTQSAIDFEKKFAEMK